MNEKNDYKNDSEIKLAVKKYETLYEKISNFDITNNECQIEAADILKKIKSTVKLIEEKRKFYTVPVNLILSGINGYFKEIKMPFEDLISDLSEKMKNYHKLQLEQKQKEDEKLRLKIEKAVKKNKPIPIINKTIVEKSIKSEKSKTNFIEKWRGEIIDKNEFFKFCIENNFLHLLQINNKELNIFVKSVKDTQKIPGLIIERDFDLSSR